MDMEVIRKALGKPIVRVETDDFEQMEKVSFLLLQAIARIHPY